MIFIPILMIVGGTAALVTAIASGFGEDEPAPPVPIDPEAPTSPVIPSVDPTIDQDEVDALARVLASEAGSGTSAEQRGIAWTVRNRFRGKSIYKGETPWRAQYGSNPPFSSARPATDATRAFAKQILSQDASQDPTGGATSFFEPRMQDIFAKAGAMARDGGTGDRVIDGVTLHDITRFKNYKKNAAQIREKWGHGSALYAAAGRFEFWGSASQLARRGGLVKTIVAGWGGGSNLPFNDIPDPLALLPKYRGR